MKFYSKEKFKTLSYERKAQVCLDLIYKIEANWENLEIKSESLALLKSYFSWFDFLNCEDDGVLRLNPFQEKLNVSLSERSLLDLAVPLERFLKQSLKDDQILNITFRDDKERTRKTFPIILVLDHLRSAFNVGSIFRMAECLGVEHIYLVGYTPTPEDDGVVKTAMGTHKLVPWSQFNHMDDVIGILKAQDVQLVGLETVQNAQTISELSVSHKVALFVGNERFGLSEDILKKMDSCAVIPMMGTKNSLNVAHSLSIATYEVSRKFQ